MIYGQAGYETRFSMAAIRSNTAELRSAAPVYVAWMAYASMLVIYDFDSITAWALPTAYLTSEYQSARARSYRRAKIWAPEGSFSYWLLFYALQAAVQPPLAAAMSRGSISFRRDRLRLITASHHIE